MESDTERENNPDVGDFPTQRTEHSIARQRRRFGHVQGFCRGQKRKVQRVRAKRGDLIFCCILIYNLGMKSFKKLRQFAIKKNSFKYSKLF